ncbi:Thiamine-phosphate synthase [Vibrio stylophorae]|uniref:Thiamine-phosphate synthase n=1 Tax=Vibrio stylophorae TaxID=659351 RepID=A0ABN8DMC9_9VIBR|nr:Thiamine-phosphate synthase [Vibrio stylophorae]
MQTDYRTGGFAAIDPAKFSLYPVVDDLLWIRRLLAAGVKTIQLRIKNPMQTDLEQQIIDAIALGRRYDAQLFINDHWALAIRHGAYGVHLGQEDLAHADLNAIRDAGLRLGLSSRTQAERERAEAIAPSYIALGHIFPTTTKVMPTAPQGVATLAQHQAEIGSRFPTVAIGGIDLETVDAVWATGVTGIAVVRAITEAADPEAAVRAFYAKLAAPQPIAYLAPQLSPFA